MVRSVAQRPRLFLGAFGAGNDVLRLTLDPEVWRVIRQICDQRDEGRFSGSIVGQAFRQFAIEVRDDGDDKVRGIFSPIRSQRLHDRGMVEANRSLKDAEELRRKSRPATAQNLVVGVLDSDAGEAAQQIEGIEQFLYVEKSDIPRAILLSECVS